MPSEAYSGLSAGSQRFNSPQTIITVYSYVFESIVPGSKFTLLGCLPAPYVYSEFRSYVFFSALLNNKAGARDFYGIKREQLFDFG